MNKLYKYTSAVLVLLFTLSGHAYANTSDVSSDNLCRNSKVVVAFMNGVFTTLPNADKSKLALEMANGLTTESGKEIRYELLYNYTNGFEDLVEVFEQRLAEHGGLLAGRFELLLESLNGKSAWWEKILESFSFYEGTHHVWLDFYKTEMIHRYASLIANPPLDVNYNEHRVRIDNWALEGMSVMLVAHSQGNLFANAAYNYAVSQIGTGAVKVVHVAPASVITNGEHVLADKDLVIKALSLTGAVPPHTDTIPPYLLRPGGFNDQTDVLGHDFLEIYMNEALDISSALVEKIQAGINALKEPDMNQGMASSGFFTITLTWDGEGDVDLHAYEPSGKQVYYADKKGDSGFLDVDNTSAYGPEHYYASCNKNELREGEYAIKLANYERAQDRTATVQLASWDEGVLSTRYHTFGAATESTPSASIFNVVVSKDAETQEYKLSYQ